MIYPAKIIEAMKLAYEAHHLDYINKIKHNPNEKAVKIADRSE